MSFVLAASAFAAEVLPPHVADSATPDSCAMCHRGHTAGSEITATDQLGTEHNALIVGTFTEEEGDTQLCFTCHGVELLGATVDVQTDFSKLSYHRLTPEVSPYGPETKQCSSCHDSHGAAKVTTGTPFPALLRSREPNGDLVFTGDAYCASCHDLHTQDAWDGLSVWKKTAHADIPAPASGTNIVCSVCHAPHGSDNTALIVAELLPPSADDTTTVPANDRRLCFVCHTAPLATYSGVTAYEESAHGSTVATVAVTAEWASRLPTASAETTRLAGECQVCHASMGRDDGTGEPIAKLAQAEGTALCYRCHGEDSELATDIESLLPTAVPEAVPEVIAAYGATPATTQFGLVQIYSRESSIAALPPTPRQLVEGSVGPLTSGDIDGDGVAEVVVARKGTTRATIVEQSSLAGLSAFDAILLAEAQRIDVGDVLNDAGNLNEVVAVTGSVVRVYRWNDSTLTMVPSMAATVAGTVSGIAMGDVSGTTLEEIVLTTQNPSQLYVIDGGSGSLVVGGPYSLGGAARLPQGPSVGDLDGNVNGKGEIAVAFGGEATVEVRSATGVLLATGSLSGAGQRRAQRTFIHDVLWGTRAAGRTGAEVSATFSTTGPGTSAQGPSVQVFPQTAAGLLGAPIPHLLPNNTFPAEMAAGDVDADGRDELLVARAGSLAGNPPVPPALHVVQTNAAGTGLVANSVFYVGAGVEAADSGPGPAWIAVAEMGDVGLSRHAVGAGDGSHVSTETAGFARHLECVDCHNTHEATSTVAPAPNAYGAIQGTWGVAIDITEKQGIDYEYELCLKCHSSWAPSPDTRDIAEEIGATAASSHAITGVSTTSQATAGSFVPPWGNGSVMHCVDCHGNATTSAPRGPHVSAQAPLLFKPYWGTAPSATDHMCYACHRYDVYYTGAADVAVTSRSFFRSGATRLHREHGLTRGRSCAACHVSHGGTVERLLRSDIGYSRAGNVVTCTNGCHGATPARSYTRP